MRGLKEVKSEGVDVMVALDVSKSMEAEDLGASRLAVAKRSIERLIDQLDGDRIGLVIFGGDAFVQCPITTDYGAAKLFLQGVNTGAIPVQGTAVGQGHRSLFIGVFGIVSCLQNDCTIYGWGKP